MNPPPLAHSAFFRGNPARKRILSSSQHYRAQQSPSSRITSPTNALVSALMHPQPFISTLIIIIQKTFPVLPTFHACTSPPPPLNARTCSTRPSIPPPLPTTSSKFPDVMRPSPYTPLPSPSLHIPSHAYISPHKQLSPQCPRTAHPPTRAANSLAPHPSSLSTIPHSPVLFRSIASPSRRQRTSIFSAPRS